MSIVKKTSTETGLAREADWRSSPRERAIVRGGMTGLTRNDVAHMRAAVRAFGKWLHDRLGAMPKNIGLSLHDSHGTVVPMRRPTSLRAQESRDGYSFLLGVQPEAHENPMLSYADEVLIAFVDPSDGYIYPSGTTTGQPLGDVFQPETYESAFQVIGRRAFGRLPKRASKGLGW